MKAMIVFRHFCEDEIFKFFSQLHLPLLPIAGKPLMAYLIDFFELMGVREVRIASEGDDGLIEEFLYAAKQKKDSYKNLTFSFSLLNQHDSIKQAFLKNKNFWKTGETYFIYGYGFLLYHCDQVNKLSELFLKNASNEARENFFWGKLENGSLKLPVFKSRNPKKFHLPKHPSKFIASKVSAVPLNSCHDYYKLSLALLNDYSDFFALQNKDNEDNKDDAATSGSCIGEKSIIRKRVILEENFLIGDRVVIEEECEIGKNSILCDDVFVNEGTRIANSIILPKTYLGKWLNIVDAIVYQDTLIHLPSGHIINFKDDCITGSLQYSPLSHSLRRFSDAFLAALIICCQTPAMLFFHFFVKNYYSTKRFRRFAYLNVQYDILELWYYRFNKGSFLAWVFMQFFLDKRELLKLVFYGKLSLLGSQPLEIKLANKLAIGTTRFYAPGAFWYNEAVDSFSDEEQEVMINDLYFLNYSTPFKNLRIFLKIIFRRFFKWA